MIRSSQDKDALSEDEKVAAACRDAGDQVLLRAEQTGTPIVVWRDGQIVHLTAAQLRAEWNDKRKSRKTED